MRSNYKNLFEKCRIQSISSMPNYFFPTFVLGKVNGKDITVIEMLNIIEQAIIIVKTYFDVNQDKYSQTLKFLKMCKSILKNERFSKPRNEKQFLQNIIDVFHEVSGIYAKNDYEKMENERFYQGLKLLIEMFYHAN